MRITLLGVLGALAVAAFFVYVGYELHRRGEKREPSSSNPATPPVNP